MSSVKDVLWSRKLSNMGYVNTDISPVGSDWLKRTNSSGWWTGSSRSVSTSSTEKIAVLVPIPTASERTATAVNAGLLRSIRRP